MNNYALGVLVYAPARARIVVMNCHFARRGVRAPESEIGEKLILHNYIM